MRKLESLIITTVIKEKCNKATTYVQTQSVTTVGRVPQNLLPYFQRGLCHNNHYEHRLP